MPQTLLEIAKELTLTLVEAGKLPPEDMQNMLQKTHATLLTLKAQEDIGATTTVPVFETPPAVVDWRKSITRRAISCLECGKTFRQLSRRHLMIHGLDSRSYRAKYGIPRTQSLAARETTARRKQIAQERRPWETAPTYRRSQQSDGHASPKPETEALRDEIEEPSAAAPAQPKRQRKTAPKKTARKQSREG